MNTKILTKREYEVFSLLILNKTTKEIAENLKISEKTLGVNGRASAVIELLKLKEITL